MKLEYFADTDSLYIDFRDQPSVESAHISTGFVVDYDADGRVVGRDPGRSRGSASMDAVHLSRAGGAASMENRSFARGG
jgi:hypothetical protein